MVLRALGDTVDVAKTGGSHHSGISTPCRLLPDTIATSSQPGQTPERQNHKHMDEMGTASAVPPSRRTASSHFRTEASSDARMRITPWAHIEVSLFAENYVAVWNMT